MDVNGGVSGCDGNLLSVGVTGENNLTVNGDTLTDNVDDTTKSLPVPVLTGDCRDTRNHADEDDISTDVEKLAKANKEYNTTVTKCITLLNAFKIPPVWSLTDHVT